MRILLLISAFLAALTGGVAHARAAGPVSEVSVSLVRAERSTRVAPLVIAAAAVRSRLAGFAVPKADPAPARRMPLYADRLLI